MIALQIDALKNNNPGIRTNVELAKLRGAFDKIGLDSERVQGLLDAPDALQQEFRVTFPTMSELAGSAMTGRGAGGAKR